MSGKQDVEVTRVMKKGMWTEAEGQRMVAAWRASGQTRAAFARRHGESPRRLNWWLARLEKSPEAKEAKGVRFHPVRVVNKGAADRGSSDERIEIRLRDGCSVHVPRGFPAEELRKVLVVLAARA